MLSIYKWMMTGGTPILIYFGKPPYGSSAKQCEKHIDDTALTPLMFGMPCYHSETHRAIVLRHIP